MFIDEAEITVHGGKGGSGKVAFFINRKGPCGGEGGKGGNVYFKLNANVRDLHKYSSVREYKAEDGESGGNNNCVGADGKDIYLHVPKGTFIIDQLTLREYELTEAHPVFLCCRGGEGGLGNSAFKSSTHRTPRRADSGKVGEEKHIKLIQKLIADYGLIGLPNAGKSSLLNELTSASVKTASYPFTTLEPNLGVLGGNILADIPGLIEGASKGKGLGFRFLRHIEKVKLIVHCISVESSNLKKDYETVVSEIKEYNPLILKKPVLILLTKIDLVSPDRVSQLVLQLSGFKHTVLPVSIHDWDSLEKLKKTLSNHLDSV